MATEASRRFHSFPDALGGNAGFKQSQRVLLFGERGRAAAKSP